MSRKYYDFIVVGAGITGLELGALLSHDGYRVLVLEKTRSAGGRARLWKHKGYVVDYGIHLIRFGPESAVTKIFRHLGREIDYIKPGPSYVMDRDGVKRLFPTSPSGFLGSGMFTLLDRILAMALMIKIRMGRYDDLKETSVREWMVRHGVRGGLARYFILVSASMMVCPFIERSSAGEMFANIGRVLKAGYSVMYPRGGWQPLFDLLEDKIGAKGEIRTGVKVDSVIVEDGRAAGVNAGGEALRCGRVIVSVPVGEIFGGLLDEKLLDGRAVRQCRRLKPTAGIVLDYGLKTCIRDDSGLWYLWSPMSFGMFTSNLEPCLAPEGRQLLTWLYPTELEDMKNPGMARKREAEIEQALFEAFPGLEQNIEWRRAMRLRMVDGVEVNVSQHAQKRIGPLLPGLKDLYLVGDSTRARGAGGDVGHESVLECYRAITGRRL